ncbi:unnamed protein product [Vicia faba]|uniref:RNase H type-1 domain-containing protein n=1 Tax=Vicia faba TaxID=3906 RepID=A0AAV1B1G4_VICFA|nr:unnamed protein product [Vicia faba]
MRLPVTVRRIFQSLFDAPSGDCSCIFWCLYLHRQHLFLIFFISDFTFFSGDMCTLQLRFYVSWFVSCFFPILHFSGDLCSFRIRFYTPRYCTLEFDGASSGNPGKSGAEAVLRSGNEVHRFSRGLGTQTNNSAEYQGLILGLKEANNKGYDHVEIRGDSKLVCEQFAAGQVQEDYYYY